VPGRVRAYLYEDGDAQSTNLVQEYQCLTDGWTDRHIAIAVDKDANSILAVIHGDNASSREDLDLRHAAVLRHDGGLCLLTRHAHQLRPIGLRCVRRGFHHVSDEVICCVDGFCALNNLGFSSVFVGVFDS